MRNFKFHQGFKLDRERLATLVRCIAEHEATSKKAAAVYMGIGEAAAEGCLGWLLKTGLGTAARGTYILTPLGALVAAHDDALAHQSTLWLLHYALVSEQNERSEVWYRAFNELISPGMAFTRESLQSYVERSLEVLPIDKSAIANDCKEFMKGYLAPTALGKLELVREAKNNEYEAGLMALPAPHIFAYVLFDAWQRRFPHADTLRITQICQEPELPGKVFAARRDQIVQLLHALQSLGLVNVVDSQHEPVTRRFREAPLQLLTSYYAAL